ncbi:MAG: hypothetical protein ACI9YE_002856, partial [Psychroserpens sp.]
MLKNVSIKTIKKSFKPTGNVRFDEAILRMDHHMQIANSAFATRCNYLRGLKSL